jgi:hypothetical protein
MKKTWKFDMKIGLGSTIYSNNNYSILIRYDTISITLHKNLFSNNNVIDRIKIDCIKELEKVERKLQYMTLDQVLLYFKINSI